MQMFPNHGINAYSSLPRSSESVEHGSKCILGRFPSTQNSGRNGTFWLHGSDPSYCAFCYCGFAADGQQTQNYTLKEKSKYWLYHTEHSTVEKRRRKTKGGGILFRVESLWMQVKVKNSCELKRYVSQNIRTIRSNSWNCTVNKFGVLANLYSARLCCIHFSLIDKLL